MSKRKKNGRVVVVPPPVAQSHGRALPSAAAVRTRIEPGDPAERLAFAVVERTLQARGIVTGSSARAVKARIDRARAELALQPTGAEEARAITRGLTANGGAVLRSVEKASPDLREFAARAAVRFVAYVREHDVRSTAALVMLSAAAQWSAIGDALRDRLFTKLDADTIRMARDASSAARLDVLSALQVEQEARVARQPTFDASRFAIPPRPTDASSDADDIDERDEPAEEQTEPDDEATINPVYREPAPDHVTSPAVTPAMLAAAALGVQLEPTPDALRRAREAEEAKQQEREQLRRWERMR
jgi:hypothetical protein